MMNQIVNIKNNLEIITSEFDSGKINYKSILEDIRNEVFDFVSKNSEFLGFFSSVFDLTKILIFLNNIEINKNHMLHHTATLNPNLRIDGIAGTPSLNFNESIIYIKTLSNIVGDNINGLNDEFKKINIDRFNDNYDNFINRFQMGHFSSKRNIYLDLVQQLISNIDHFEYVKRLLETCKIDIEFIVSEIETNQHNLSHIILNKINVLRDDLNSYSYLINSVLGNLNSIRLNFGIFISGIDETISTLDNNTSSAKNRILGLSTLNNDIRTMRETINIIKKSTPFTAQLNDFTITSEFKERFGRLRRLSISTYHHMERDIASMFTYESGDKSPHFTYMGSDFFGKLHNIFKLIEDETDPLAIRSFYSTFNFERFYSSVITLLENYRKNDQLYEQIRSYILNRTFALRDEFNVFIQQVSFNFYGYPQTVSNSNKLISFRTNLDFCYYTLNLAAPQGVSNSRLEYTNNEIHINNNIIKDNKLFTIKLNTGTKYNLRFRLSHVSFGIENSFSDAVIVDVDISTSLNNTLLPARSYISPSFEGASFLFGYGNVNDKSTFFISLENITEIVLNYIKVEDYDNINSLAIIIDHEVQDELLIVNNKMIKQEQSQFTQKTCLYNNNPISGLYEFGLLELSALAHDDDYSNMTIEELVKSGVNNLVISNSYYYKHGLVENGMDANDVSDVSHALISKYLLQFSQYLKTVLANWIDRDLYIMSSEQIETISYDFCSVYMYDVLKTLNIDNYDEIISYQAELVVIPRLTQQIDNEIGLANPTIVNQIYNNVLAGEVKLEFRSICRHYISELYDNIPVSNREREALTQIMSNFETCYADCIPYFNTLIESFDDKTLVFNSVYEPLFRTILEPLTRNYANYFINETRYISESNSAIVEMSFNLSRFLRLHNIDFRPHPIRMTEAYANITGTINRFISQTTLLRI